jgi:hypothetical protein
MAIQFSDVSEKRMLDALLAVSGADTWTMRLAQNDHTPAAADVQTGGTPAYTECTFPGYAPVPMGSTFPAATTDGAGKASSQYPADVSFVCSGGGAAQSAFEWYVTDSANRIIMAEKFAAPGPYLMQALGATITVRPTVKLNDPLT